MKKHSCVACHKENLDKDTVAINKKILGRNIVNFYCIDCLASNLGCSVQNILDKIEECKSEGCALFE